MQIEKGGAIDFFPSEFIFQFNILGALLKFRQHGFDLTPCVMPGLVVIPWPNIRFLGKCSCNHSRILQRHSKID